MCRSGKSGGPLHPENSGEFWGSQKIFQVHIRKIFQVHADKKWICPPRGPDNISYCTGSLLDEMGMMKAENFCQKSEINVKFKAFLREGRKLNKNINKMLIKQKHLIISHLSYSIIAYSITTYLL